MEASVDSFVSEVVLSFFLGFFSVVSFPLHAVSDKAAQSVRMVIIFFLVFMVKISFTDI